MHIYSKQIIAFASKLKKLIQTILTHELDVQVAQNHFYFVDNHSYYPIKVVIYNDRSSLGYFDPEFLELGFHERLMDLQTDILCNIVRHEIAHYFVYLISGNVQAHGSKFKSFCNVVGWGKEVSDAAMYIEEESFNHTAEECAVMRKIQKLMSLSGSSNENEAEQAMLKAQDLLLKHNLEKPSLIDANDEKWILKRVLKEKRRTTKMSAICSILSTFFVSVVFNRSQDFVCLQILGAAVNVDIAEYVALFLDDELERLWLNCKKQHKSLQGLVAKNSFFSGIAHGYCAKADAQKNACGPASKQALMCIEGMLMDMTKLVYPTLKNTKGTRKLCPESEAIGHGIGQSLTINPGINGPATQSELALTHF